MTGFLDDYGLVLLFAVIGLQAAGVGGLPGKTALVTAAILAARGSFSIVEVIAVAAVAGIAGGYLGYVVFRTGGRRLVRRPRVQARLARPLGMAERFFDAHGSKAVFLARFLPGLKVVAAPAAGISCMRWWPFAVWHGLGAIAFAVGFGLAAYFAGSGAIELAERYGTYAVVPLALVLVAAAGFVLVRRYGGPRLRSATPPRTSAPPS